MQRLFSSFADGWPGVGLFFQRLLAGALLLICALWTSGETSDISSQVPYVIAAAAGILLVIGLWTPLAGALVAFIEMWIVFARAHDPLIPVVLAILGATLAMIGPGAWSIDAKLFGRKHIDTL